MRYPIEQSVSDQLFFKSSALQLICEIFIGMKKSMFWAIESYQWKPGWVWKQNDQKGSLSDVDQEPQDAAASSFSFSQNREQFHNVNA